MANNEPKLPIRARLVGLEYAGAPIEFEPALDYEASWPGARFSRRLSPSLPTGGTGIDFDLPLPANGGLAGDTLWLMLVAQTHVSAVADIDAREAAYRQTDLESGTTHISLDALVEAAKAADTPVQLEVVSELVFRVAIGALMSPADDKSEAPTKLTPEMVRKAAGAATKAVISLEVPADLLAARPETRAWLDGHRKGHCRSAAVWERPFPFGSEAFHDAHARLMGRLEEAYVLNATDLALPDGRRGRFPPTADDPLMAHLHMARYETRTGPLPPIAYLMQDLVDRLPPGAAGAELRNLDEHAPVYAEQLQLRLMSALLAVGMDADAFVAAVTEATGPTGDYVTAVSVLPQMASLAMTRVRYKADARLPNLRFVLAEWTPAEQRRLLPAEFFASAPTAPPPMAGVPPINVDAILKTASGRPGGRMAALLARAHAAQANSPAGRVLAAHGRAHTDAATMGRMRTGARARPRARVPPLRPVKGGRGAGRFPAVVHMTPPGRTSLGPALTTDEASRPVPPGAGLAVSAWAHAFVSEDDWSSGILGGKLNADDCDGTGAGTVVMLERDKRVLDMLARKAPSLMTLELRALHALHQCFMPLFVGATVSEAYVEKESAATPGAATPTAPKHIRLPTRGSPEAAKYGQGGHGHGLMLPVAQVCEAHLRALDLFPDTAVAAADRVRVRGILEREVAAAPAWMRSAPALRLVLEGTGPVFPLIAPVEEAMPGDAVAARKVASRIAMARAIKFHGFGPTWDTPFAARTQREPLATLADLVRVESQPYEARARVRTDQWVSNFYRGVGGVFALRFLDMGLPTLASSSAISLPPAASAAGAKGATRGVDMATFLLQPDAVAFHSHTGASMTTADWQRDVVPVLRCALEQHVAANYLREPTALPAAHALCLPVAPTEVAALAAGASGSPSLSLGASVDAVLAALPVASREALNAIGEASGRADRTVLATTVDLEQLRAVGTERTTALVTALDTLRTAGAIVDYAFVHEHPLRQCPPCLQLLLLLPVADRMDETLFPRS